MAENKVTRLNRFNDLYKNKENKTLSEIFDSFSCISKEYSKIDNELSNNDIKYSNPLYNNCTNEEKEQFFNDQLQFIECYVTNSIRENDNGLILNWKRIYDLLFDPDYATTPKADRKSLFPTSMNRRPVGENSVLMWNGLQIIDIDIKNEDIARELKYDIFNDLNKYHWFLGICLSASGKSLHVWTKITPISVSISNRRVEFSCNFRHKYSYIYITLCKYMEKYHYTIEDIIHNYLDMAMAKPQQAIFISSDNTALMSTNFKDFRLDVNFESAFNIGIEGIDWINHPDLKGVFARLEWFANNQNDTGNLINLSNIDDIGDYDLTKDKGKKHYKHNQRWQLANTLTALFGENKAYSIMQSICKDTNPRELYSDVKTAKIHNKPISIWAVRELNNYHGFNIKIKEDIQDKLVADVDKKIQEIGDKVDPIKILNDNTNQVLLTLKKDQYLSDIKQDILKNLSHITLLEAGAGYGKTEMIKSLKSKTLLILPFTSTIKAKVEASAVTRDWLYYYGSHKPTLQELLGNKNMSMTIDKFSNLNVYELDSAQFEYIVIDESHLLFTSSYRDVMGPCIQRLANCKAKIIMMTGTPTGEMLFFPNIKHIRVKKEDTRIKEFIVNLVPTRTEQIIDMCTAIADDIMQHRRILFPTNKGILYYEQITGIIQRILNERNFPREIKKFYYKKSQYGAQTMEDINNNKTIGNVDIIFCSTYLSVGVDICDPLPFSVYFSEPWISQDIEQFANRLRNNDLYVKLYLPRFEENGFPINYSYVQPLDLSFSREELIMARDFAKSANDMIIRNEEESKFNLIISSIINSKNYLKYDENSCRYYIDETSYKLKVFEDRYSDYSKQLEIMKQGMQYYGYSIKINTSNNRIDEQIKEQTEVFMRSCRNLKFNEDTIKVRELLNHVTDANIDNYRELLRGNYSIFRDQDEANERIRRENDLYVKDIEILEKHIPVILSLYRNYDCDTIRDIYEYCIDKKTNRLNFSKLKRIKTFVQIEVNRRRRRLDFPIIRMVKDFQAWARDHHETTQPEIDRFLAIWTCKYCNSIPDLVIEDKQYLEEMFEFIKEYWEVIITKNRIGGGKLVITPFELLWETKQQLNNIYGDMNTQTFFLEQLINEKQPTEQENDEEEVPEFTMANKVKIADIMDSIKDIIHEDYDYFNYSEVDKSNERFMKKQYNTNQLRDRIFNFTDDEDDDKNDNKQKDLFDNI